LKALNSSIHREQPPLRGKSSHGSLRGNKPSYSVHFKKESIDVEKTLQKVRTSHSLRRKSSQGSIIEADAHPLKEPENLKNQN